MEGEEGMTGQGEERGGKIKEEGERDGRGRERWEKEKMWRWDRDEGQDGASHWLMN